MNMFAFSSNTSVLSYGHKVAVPSVQDVTIHEDEEASAVGKGNDSYLRLSYHFIKCCGLQLNQYCYIITRHIGYLTGEQIICVPVFTCFWCHRET
jgi:hypothetical protein